MPCNCLGLIDSLALFRSKDLAQQRSKLFCMECPAVWLLVHFQRELSPAHLENSLYHQERGRRFAGVDSPDPVILVLGGSSGAESVNRLVFSCLPALCSKFTVIHQTGGKTNGLEPQLQSAVQEWQAKKRYFPFSFIAGEMPDVLAAADLVLSRSGAGAVWESAAAGKPMVLLPLEKGSSRGDQVENAEYFKAKGLCRILREGDLTADSLIEEIENLIADDNLKAALGRYAPMCGNANILREINSAIRQ